MSRHTHTMRRDQSREWIARRRGVEQPRSIPHAAQSLPVRLVAELDVGEPVARPLPPLRQQLIDAGLLVPAAKKKPEDAA
jgi:hypothetical protein